MRVLIAGAVSPFSGREEIAWMQAIYHALKAKKVEVDSFLLPVVQNPLLIPEQMMAFRLMDVSSSSDLLVAVGYPAFVLKHPRKRILLFSLASTLHEWFDSEYGVLSTPQYQQVRSAVMSAERRCLSEAERVVCASKTLTEKLLSIYRLKSIPLSLGDCPEYNNQELENLPAADNWVVCETTLEPADRIDLLLDAVQAAQENWKLKLFVPSGSDVYLQALYQRINRLGLQERALVTNSSLSTTELCRSRAYVALSYATTRIPNSVHRAVRVGTPVITASDCGAILEAIGSTENGLVVDPSAGELARGIDTIASRMFSHEDWPSKNQEPVGASSQVGNLIDILIG